MWKTLDLDHVCIYSTSVALSIPYGGMHAVDPLFMRIGGCHSCEMQVVRCIFCMSIVHQHLYMQLSRAHKVSVACRPVCSKQKA